MLLDIRFHRRHRVDATRNTWFIFFVQMPIFLAAAILRRAFLYHHCHTGYFFNDDLSKVYRNYASLSLATIWVLNTGFIFDAIYFAHDAGDIAARLVIRDVVLGADADMRFRPGAFLIYRHYWKDDNTSILVSRIVYNGRRTGRVRSQAIIILYESHY